jgi:hypothetical protein
MHGEFQVQFFLTRQAFVRCVRLPQINRLIRNAQ